MTTDTNLNVLMTRGTTFVPGRHVALVGSRTLGLIAGDSAATREQLWRMVDGDVPIDDMLDELAIHGIKALPSLAIAQLEDTDLRLIVRGDAQVVTVSHSGTVCSVDAHDVRTWIEEVVAEVTTVTMSLADGCDELFASDDPFFVDAGVVPATVVTRTFRRATVEDSVVDTAQTSPIAPDSGLILDSEVDDESAPCIDVAPDAASERATSEGSTAVATLSFSHGERVAVTGPVLVGRNPKVSEMIDGEIPRTVRLADTTGGLSRTHASIRVVDGDLVVEDLNSTNGTDVEVPGQLPARLPAGIPMVISIGTGLVFGEELRCVVEPPD